MRPFGRGESLPFLAVSDSQDFLILLLLLKMAKEWREREWAKRRGKFQHRLFSLHVGFGAMRLIILSINLVMLGLLRMRDGKVMKGEDVCEISAV